MGATTMDPPTAEAMAAMSDADLQELVADGGEDSEQFELATAELEKRRKDFPEASPAKKGSKAREIRGEAGEATGAVPHSAPPDPLPDVDEIKIDGTAQLDMFNLGGKRATGSSLALTGGKVSLVDGQAFNKGDRIKLTIEAVINDVGQKDAHDPKTGQVVSCEQRHKARIVDVALESAR